MEFILISAVCVPPHKHTCSGSKLCSLAKIVFWTWTFVLNCSAKLAHGILSGKYAVPSKKVWRLWWFSIFYMIIVVSAACCKNVIVICLWVTYWSWVFQLEKIVALETTVYSSSLIDCFHHFVIIYLAKTLWLASVCFLVLRNLIKLDLTIHTWCLFRHWRTNQVKNQKAKL